MASSLLWPPKGPNDKLDYRVDWSAWLGGDTIIASTWIVPDGLVASDEDFDERSATIWLAGGTPPQRYDVVNHIRTAAGRTKDQSIRIFLRTR